MYYFDSVYFVRKLDNLLCDRIVAYIEESSSLINADDVPVVTVDQITPHTLIVACGGDGTMMYAMRLAAGKRATCIGVNFGNVGFLSPNTPTTFAPARLLKVLTDLTGYELDKRVVLDAEGLAVGCNEVSIAAEQSDTLLQYSVHINDKLVAICKANGLLVSTPTGSTAYSLSAGGAIIQPQAECMQLTSVAPMTLTNRPVILNSSDVVRVTPINRKAIVRVDGVTVYDLPIGESFTVKLLRDSHDRLVKSNVLRWADQTFFDVLAEKLQWKL